MFVKCKINVLNQFFLKSVFFCEMKFLLMSSKLKHSYEGQKTIKERQKEGKYLSKIKIVKIKRIKNKEIKSKQILIKN